MKIRQGFVSNSSSSSFIVQFKEGYKEPLDDYGELHKDDLFLETKDCCGDRRDIDRYLLKKFFTIMGNIRHRAIELGDPELINLTNEFWFKKE